MGVFGTFDVGKGFPLAACLFVVYTVGSGVFGFLPGDGHLVTAGYLGGNAADIAWLLTGCGLCCCGWQEKH